MLRPNEIRFLVQLVNSLEESQIKLEQAYLANDFTNFIRIKAFIERIQKSIDETLGHEE